MSTHWWGDGPPPSRPAVSNSRGPVVGYRYGVNHKGDRIRIWIMEGDEPPKVAPPTRKAKAKK